MTTSTTSTGWTRSPTSSRSRLAIPILTCAGDLVDRPEMYGGHGPPGDIHSGNPSTRFPTAPTHRGRSPARLGVRGVALMSRMPGRVSVKLTLTHDDSSDEGGEEQRGQRQRLRSQDAPPRSTHGLTTASRHRFSQTFAAAPTTTAPRSRTDSVSAPLPHAGALAHQSRMLRNRPRSSSTTTSGGPAKDGERGANSVAETMPAKAEDTTWHAEPAADLSVRDRRIGE